MNVTKIFETSKVKATALILGLVLAVSGVAIAMNGTFATDDYGWSAPANQPEGYANENIIIKQAGNVSLPIPGVNTANTRFAINDKIGVTYAGGAFTVAPQKAGKTGFSYGAEVTGYTSTMHYWVKDNDNIASYDMLNNWVAIRKDESTNWINLTEIEATDGLGGDVTNKIKWTSNNPSIAKFENNRVVGQNKDGYAILVGTFTDVWGFEQTVPVMVIVGNPNNGVNVTGMIINDMDDVTVMVGETINAPEVVITPSNAANQTIVWSSNKSNIASVDPVTGKVTGVSKGTARITATITNPDGSTKSASYGVTVDSTIPDDVFEDGKDGWWKDNGDNTYTKVDPENDYKPKAPDETVWGGNDGKFGGSDDKPAVNGEDDVRYVNTKDVDGGEDRNVYYPVIKEGANNGKLDKNDPVTGGHNETPGDGDDHDGSTTPKLIKDPDNSEWYLDNKDGTFDAYGPDGLIDTADDEKNVVKITDDMNKKVPPASDFDEDGDGYLNPDEKAAWEDAVKAEEEKAKTGDWGDVVWQEGGEFSASGWDWIIIGLDGNGNALVTTKYVIGNHRFAASSNVYADSELKTVMDGFYETTLTGIDAQAIANNNVNAKKITGVAQPSNYLSNTPRYDAAGGLSAVVASGGNKSCFALSYQEAQKYLAGKSYLAARSSSTLVPGGLGLGNSFTYCGSASGNSTSCYWLRSPGYDATYASNVGCNGPIYFNINSVFGNAEMCVRPALWIKIK